MTVRELLSGLILACFGCAGGVYLGVYLERRRVMLMMHNFQQSQIRKAGKLVVRK